MNRTKKTKPKTNKTSSIKTKLPQIDINKKPYCYTQYSWSPVPDIINDFVGRELEFTAFWYEMAKLVGRGPGKKSNYAFVGQRKLGKTAYLKRCYNIAFWEQDEVVPFYYSFAQNDGNRDFIIQLSELKKSMPIIFLQQFLAFYSKDDKFLELNEVENIFSYMKKIKFFRDEDLVRCIKSGLKSINENEDIFMLQNIWQFTQKLSFFVRKKCLLIIDEAQEMDISIYDGDRLRQCKASITDIIQKDHSLVFVSGSNVSMLVNNFLDYSVANRFKKKNFSPLRPEHAKELIHKRCPNGYKNLAEDLFLLVGGNPFYIEEIFNFNMNYCELYGKEKDFSCKEGLLQAYEFEVLNTKGYIYDFWNVHIHKNKDDLNQDPKGKKGLALQLLYKISSNPNKEFAYHELMEEFEINEDTLVNKIQQLEHANLIEPMRSSRLAHGFPDLVLPVFINKFYHQLIIKGPNKKVSLQAIEDRKQRFTEMNKEFDDVDIDLDTYSKELNHAKKEIAALKFRAEMLKKKIRSARGKINLRKGMKRQNEVAKKVAEMIEKQQGMFAGLDLEGYVQSVNIWGSEDTGCEIDIFAKLNKKGNKKSNAKSFTLLAEVKNQKSKVSMKQAQKFICTVSSSIDAHNLKDIELFYVSVNGFAKDVEKFLEEFGVVCGSSEKVFESR